MKNPLGPCTLAIATAMVPSTSNPASGVSRPSTNNAPATSSPPTASAVHSRAGRNPMLPMNPVAPAKPGPPNAPTDFCAPWASNTRFGLGTTEFGVLEVLYHKGELPVCEVQRRILVESSSTTYVVDKLCDRGLVRRRPSAADRRVTLLALTPPGRRLIARIFPAHAAAMRRAVAALP